MTYEESIKILAILKAAYPKDYPFNMSIDDAKVMATVWCEQFINIPGSIVEIAVKQLISTEEKILISKVKKKIGSLYWEAKDTLDRNERDVKQGLCSPLPEEEKQFYMFVKKVTENYKFSKGALEPSIAQLIGTDNNKLLLGGAVSE